MKPLSIGLCSSRFWPVVDGRSWWNRDFCTTMQELGQSVKVFSSRWSAGSPKSFEWYGVQVERLLERSWSPFGNSFNSLSPLGRSRLLRRVLSEAEQSLDLLVVNDSPRRTLTLLQVARRLNLPVLVRIEDRWLRSAHWNRIHRKLLRMQQSMGDRLRWIAASKLCENAIGNSVPVQMIRDGVRSTTACFHGEFDRIALRKAFSETHPVLDIGSDQPLVLTTGPLPENPAAVQVVKAWSQVRQKFPAARLWIAGQGRGEDRLWQEILRFELNQEVIMTGAFDCLGDLHAAADWFVVPWSDAGFDNCQQRHVHLAQARGLPLIFPTEWLHLFSADVPESCQYCGGEPNSLVAAMIRQLEKGPPRSRSTGEAGLQVADEHDFRHTGVHYLQVMESLVKPRP